MEIKDLPYSVGTPLPEVVVDKKNLYYAGLLQNLYSSCSSETGAVLQYIYQSYVTRPKEPEIADLFEHIAITEMHHHNALGSTIIKLGGLPFYTNSQGVNFNIRCVYDNTNLKQMLLKDIEDEQKAIADYNYAKNIIENESIKALLERIVEDEELHKKSLEAVLEYITFYR